MTYAIDIRTATTLFDLGGAINYVLADFDFRQGSSFSHTDFWDSFIKKHRLTTFEEVIEAVLDIGRCNFSPKMDNWPGLTVTINYKSNTNADATMDVILAKGVTKISKFNRGQGEQWSYTNGCLATAGIFHQIYGQNAEVRRMMPMCPSGVTQTMSTLQGYVEADYDAAVTAFDNFAITQNLKKRTDALKVKIKAAVMAQIAARTADNCAFSVSNTIRYLCGEAIVAANNPTK